MDRLAFVCWPFMEELQRATGWAAAPTWGSSVHAVPGGQTSSALGEARDLQSQHYGTGSQWSHSIITNWIAGYMQGSTLEPSARSPDPSDQQLTSTTGNMHITQAWNGRVESKVLPTVIKIKSWLSFQVDDTFCFRQAECLVIFNL